SVTRRLNDHALRPCTPTPIVHTKPAVRAASPSILNKLLAKAPADSYASADELAAALAPWRSADVQPLETPNDAAFQEAVRKFIDGWTVPAVKESLDDAVLFRITAEEKPPPMEFLSRSMFSHVDRFQPQV